MKIKLTDFVDLVSDCRRRDLTINSMARDLDTGEIIDPFGGIHHLREGLLVHTSAAFSEDPVRVLRVARFAARYGFQVSLETHRLMMKIVSELNFVPQERIWTEISRGLMEKQPETMIAVLVGVGAFTCENLLPYAAARPSILTSIVPSDPLAVRFSLIAGNFKREDYEACRVPVDCARVSRLFNAYRDCLLDYNQTEPAEIRLLLLRNLRFLTASFTRDCIMRLIDIVSNDLTITKSIRDDIQKINTVNCAELVQPGLSGYKIKSIIFNAQLKTLI